MEENPKVSKKIGEFLLTDKEIGRGSFGGVYLGYSVHNSNHQVAIKVLQMGDKDPEEFERCSYEIKILTSLNHPNLVKLISSVHTKEHLYMVFDYCKDGNLYTYCKNIQKRSPYNSPDRPVLTEVQAINFFKQIVAGYFHLYQHNIIHRDLKPQNIFLHGGCLKIGDFGLAKQFSQKDQAMLAETKCGTPLYMAPEINIKREYDSYCDMWSLGVIFFEMLYGKTPWNGFSEYNLFYNIQNNPLAIPQNVPRSEKVKEILRRTLEKEPSKRMKWEDFFKSVEKLEEDKSGDVIKGNLIHQNIKIMEDNDLVDFKKLEISPCKGKTPYEGVSLIEEDFNKLMGAIPKEVSLKYEKIQNGKDYIFYHRNVAALVKKTGGILIDLYRTHTISISNDLLYKLMYILQAASNLLLKNLVMVCETCFFEHKDLTFEFFQSPEFQQIKREIIEEMESSDLEMKTNDEVLNEAIQGWMQHDNDILKNIEFISLVRDVNRKEMSEYFKELYENTVKAFLTEQYDLLEEDLITEKENLRLLRYMQICCKIDNIYKILPRLSGEDNSHLFFSLYDFLDNASEEELKTLLKATMKNKT